MDLPSADDIARHEAPGKKVQARLDERRSRIVARKKEAALRAEFLTPFNACDNSKRELNAVDRAYANRRDRKAPVGRRILFMIDDDALMEAFN